MIWIYGWIGDKDRAIAQLEGLITIPCGPKDGDLRCYPHYDLFAVTRVSRQS